jgi:hypothetical protein
MSKRRAGIVVLIGLLIVVAYWLASRADALSPEVVYPQLARSMGTPSKPAPNARKDCAEQVDALRAEVDALESLESLRFSSKLAEGQAARVMGSPLPPPAAPAGEEAVRALLATQPDLEIVALDCGEYPCIVRAWVPQERTGAVSAEGLWSSLARVPNQELAFSWAVDAQDDKVEVVFAMVPAGVRRSAQVSARLSYRAHVMRAETPEAFAPPEPVLPVPTQPHPCGAVAAELDQQVRQHKDLRVDMETRLAYYERVSHLMEGRAPEWPAGMDPVVHQRTAQEIAETLDLDLVDFECDEVPCLARLVGEVDSDVTNEHVMAAMQEALTARGISPFHHSVMVAPWDPPVVVMTLALGSNDATEGKRVAMRTELLGNGEIPEEVSRSTYHWQGALE